MKTALLLILFCLPAYLSAQVDTNKLLTTAQTEAQRMSDAFLNGDYDTMLDLIHPNIVELSGGRAALKTTLQAGMGLGVTLENQVIKKPTELFINKGTYQCVLTQRQNFVVNKEKLFTLSNLIGISTDGIHWYFIGVASNSLETLQTYVPALSDDLVLLGQTNPLPR